MATIGRTLLRFTGAVLLGASATSIDNPGLLFAPTAHQSSRPEPGRVVPDVRIPPGKMALAFRFDDLNLFGLAQPNNRVDILVVANDPDQETAAAELILENVRLLAIDAKPQRLPDGRSIKIAVATIEVTPDEAERFRLARAKGSIQLILRGPDSMRIGPETHLVPLVRPR